MKQGASDFDLAVKLAAGFVANGDVRLDGNTNRESQGMEKLLDLITTLNEVVAEARERCAGAAP